jgi:peptide/nickel transport system substrate-binding protein
LAAAGALALALPAAAVTLRIANQGDALSMDPHSLNESLQITVVENVYEPLVWRDQNFKLTPVLATELEANRPHRVAL